jgi:hypothetical protein
MNNNYNKPYQKREFTRRKPERMSREWQDEYRFWYENLKRDHWNRKFRELNKHKQQRNHR